LEAFDEQVHHPRITEVVASRDAQTGVRLKRQDVLDFLPRLLFASEMRKRCCQKSKGSGEPRVLIKSDLEPSNSVLKSLLEEK
jgi:hypothetical protein